MARNTASGKGTKKAGGNAPGKGRKITNKEVRAASGANRTLVLALAGFTALAIVVIALFAVLSTGGGGGDAGSFTPNNDGLIPKGEQVPNFTAENLNSGGGNVSLDGDQRATMLVFFASWCPHCNNEAPIISDLESQYDGLKTVMIGIDNTQGDSADTTRQFVEDYDIESPAIYEPQLGQEYNVSGYPTVYVLNSDNEVVAAHSGEAPREVYEGWIEDALGQ